MRSHPVSRQAGPWPGLRRSDHRVISPGGPTPVVKQGDVAAKTRPRNRMPLCPLLQCDRRYPGCNSISANVHTESFDLSTWMTFSGKKIGPGQNPGLLLLLGIKNAPQDQPEPGSTLHSRTMKTNPKLQQPFPPLAQQYLRASFSFRDAAL